MQTLNSHESTFTEESFNTEKSLTTVKKNHVKLQKSYAVLSMDVEDWYHTGYLLGKSCDRNYSMLDGLDQFIQVLTDHGIRAQLFVLGELLSTHAAKFRELQKLGHEIASHGWSHKPPMKLSIDEFIHEVKACKHIHEQVLGVPLQGYRAPCFSLDRLRLNALVKLGLLYDSSRINRSGHNKLNLHGFSTFSRNIFRKDSFFEFQISDFSINRLSFPTSGGGAMRALPWEVIQTALKFQLKDLDVYSLYIHPIDLSMRPNPPFPSHTSMMQKWRFNQGRFNMTKRLNDLILSLKKHNYCFTTYTELKNTVLQHVSHKVQTHCPMTDFQMNFN